MPASTQSSSVVWKNLVLRSERIRSRRFCACALCEPPSLTFGGLRCSWFITQHFSSFWYDTFTFVGSSYDTCSRYHVFTSGTSKHRRVRPDRRLNGRGALYSAMPSAVVSMSYHRESCLPVNSGAPERMGNTPSLSSKSSSSSTSYASHRYTTTTTTL